VRVTIIALLGVLLAGCAPKPLPDWALARHGEPGAARLKAAPGIERRWADRGPPSHVTFTPPQADVLPFTPEWQTREEAFDNRLRRTMNICRRC